mmetsp:Transcript_30862/g.98466  ORF Transcript_30862/g.98466 Transcript_30862/m.98466 type:complete len:369 (+) Transcript_30862:298-1404(+)
MIISTASSQIRASSTVRSPSSPMRLRGAALTTARARAPRAPEASFEESVPSAGRWRREQVQQRRETKASKGMGRRQRAATAKVWRKLPVHCASRMDNATTGRIADCTNTRAVPDSQTAARHLSASLQGSLLAQRLGDPGMASTQGPAGTARLGKRVRSLSVGSRLGKASSTQARYARLMRASTTEGSSSGALALSSPEPARAAVAAGSSAPRPRPRSLTRKLRDCRGTCWSLVLTEASTKRTWKRMPEPRPCTSRASSSRRCGSQPSSCESTMQTWPSSRKLPKRQRPAKWLARRVTVRVSHRDSGMGRYTPPMSRPTNIISEARGVAVEALMWRKAEASTAVEFAEKRPQEARQMSFTRVGGTMDSP